MLTWSKAGLNATVQQLQVCRELHVFVFGKRSFCVQYRHHTLKKCESPLAPPRTKESPVDRERLKEKIDHWQAVHKVCAGLVCCGNKRTRVAWFKWAFAIVSCIFCYIEQSWEQLKDGRTRKRALVFCWWSDSALREKTWLAVLLKIVLRPHVLRKSSSLVLSYTKTIATVWLVNFSRLLMVFAFHSAFSQAVLRIPL